MSEQTPSNPVQGAVPSAPFVQPSASPSVLHIWINAVTKPSERTYAEIASSPGARTGTAFAWIFIAALVSSLVSRLVATSAESLLKDLGAAPGEAVVNAMARVWGALWGAFGEAILGVLSFAIVVGLINLVARLFGGHATFAQMAYTMAAIALPVSLVEAVLTLPSGIEFIGLCFDGLVLLAALYGLVLEVIAVKAVHQISWGGAIVAAVGVPIVLIGCIAVVVIAVLMILGPEIGSVFSSINSSLPTVP